MQLFYIPQIVQVNSTKICIHVPSTSFEAMNFALYTSSSILDVLLL